MRFVRLERASLEQEEEEESISASGSFIGAVKFSSSKVQDTTKSIPLPKTKSRSWITASRLQENVIKVITSRSRSGISNTSAVPLPPGEQPSKTFSSASKEDDNINPVTLSFTAITESLSASSEELSDAIGKRFEELIHSTHSKEGSPTTFAATTTAAANTPTNITTTKRSTNTPTREPAPPSTAADFSITSQASFTSSLTHQNEEIGRDYFQVEEEPFHEDQQQQQHQVRMQQRTTLLLRSFSTQNSSRSSSSSRSSTSSSVCSSSASSLNSRNHHHRSHPDEAVEEILLSTTSAQKSPMWSYDLPAPGLFRTENSVLSGFSARSQRTEEILHRVATSASGVDEEEDEFDEEGIEWEIEANGGCVSLLDRDNEMNVNSQSSCNFMNSPSSSVKNREDGTISEVISETYDDDDEEEEYDDYDEEELEDEGPFGNTLKSVLDRVSNFMTCKPVSGMGFESLNDLTSGIFADGYNACPQTEAKPSRGRSKSPRSYTPPGLDADDATPAASKLATLSACTGGLLGGSTIDSPLQQQQKQQQGKQSKDEKNVGGPTEEQPQLSNILQSMFNCTGGGAGSAFIPLSFL